jgi:hypothetical protein
VPGVRHAEHELLELGEVAKGDRSAAGASPTGT